MRLDINLATHRYEDARQFWLRWGGGIALLGILTLVLLYTAFAGWNATQKDRRLVQKYQDQIATRDQERARAEAMLNLPENREVRDRSQFLNALFERKAFSWTRVFEELERVMPAGLHVVSIQPQITQENELAIKLSVSGNSRDHALDLVRRMESSPAFRQTQIESEAQNRNPTSPQDSVQFSISALYVPQAPETNIPATTLRPANAPHAHATSPMSGTSHMAANQALRPAMRHPFENRPAGNPAWQRQAGVRGGAH